MNGEPTEHAEPGSGPSGPRQSSPADGSQTDAEASWQMPAGGDTPVPKAIGVYPVEDEIGRGGMGIVYRARDPRLDRTVALKVLPEALVSDPLTYARFEREAKLLAMVSHPNIATIHALEDAASGPFLVLEFVPGQSLSERLAGGALDLDETLRTAVQIAAGVEAAHHRGVVHRDLKPANVRVTPTGSVKVLDFGLAKSVIETDADSTAAPDQTAAAGSVVEFDDGSELTTAGSVLGTAAYMSPEQIAGGIVDHRTDVWAFGCVVWECLTGRKLWGQARNQERFAAIQTEEPPWETLPAGTPAALRELLERCLAKQMPSRLPHIGDARVQLEALLDQRRGRRPAASRLGNLPRPLTSFLGRESEIATLVEQVAGPGLTTLVGPGGCGKTRLALEVGRRLQPDVRHGAFFIDLAPVQSAELIARAMVRALTVQEDPSREPIDRLIEHLGDRDILLVVDNCEHLLVGCAEVLETLLASCSGVRLLATSREPLQVSGEQMYWIPPFKAPDPKRHTTALELAEFDAVRLFVERAGRADPTFALTDANAAPVAEICQRLDGIPLALELAAARVRALGIEQIVARLDDRFALLRGGSRTAPRRHQTLRALVDWSYDQLDPESKTLLRRLAIFAGGFSLEAAEAVCGYGAIETTAVLDLLTGLLDRSLVVLERRPRTIRYRMLETLREYGRDRLIEAGEQPDAEQHHLEYYSRLAAEASEPLAGPDAALWLERLDDERDDLRAALRCCESSPERALIGLTMAVDLESLWRLRAHLSEGREHLAALLVAAPSELNETRLRAMATYLRILNQAGLFEPGRELVKAALTQVSETGSQRWRATFLTIAANMDFAVGERAQAERQSGASVELWRGIGDDLGYALALHDHATLELRIAKLPESIGHARECLAIFRRLDRLNNAAQALNTLSVALLHAGEYGESVSCLDEAYRIRMDFGDLRSALRVRVNQAVGTMAAGDAARATDLFLDLVPLARRLDDHEAAGFLYNNVAAAALLANRVELARANVREGLELAIAKGWPLLTTNLIENCARIELARGNLRLAAILLGAAERTRLDASWPRMAEDQAEHEDDLRRLREALGHPRTEELLAEGATLGLDRAAELALGR